MNFLPRLALNHGLPISASQVARVTGLRYCAGLHCVFYSIDVDLKEAVIFSSSIEFLTSL
jgi:hypothetical protein